MIPDEPAPDARSRPTPTTPPTGGAGSRTGDRARLVLSVAAVAFAAIGLLSLAAILTTAFLGGTVWPGFVLVSYFCLPIAFLLMSALLIRSAVARRRS